MKRSELSKTCVMCGTEYGLKKDEHGHWKSVHNFNRSVCCSNPCKAAYVAKGNYERSLTLTAAREAAAEQHRIWWKRFCFGGQVLP